MSEAHDAAEEFDLTDVPMDEPEVDEAAGSEEAPDPEGEQAAEQARAPLAPEEIAKRYASTKTALAGERARRREVERQLAEARSGGQSPRQAVQERIEPEDPEVDPEQDPMAALRLLSKKVAAYEQAERLEQQTVEQRNAREAALTRVEAAFAEHEADFREDNADYDDAAKHYAVSRAQELMQFGIDPHKVQPMLRDEFANLAATAIRAGKNPASVVYAMAKGRGYGKAAAADGATPSKTKLGDVARGQRAASPLSTGGGRAASGLDAATIANIDIRTKKGRESFERAFEAVERQAKAGR
jgi:hypothetical protein